MKNLGQGQGGGEINDEIRLEVPRGNLMRIHDELAPAKNAGAGGDEGHPELHEHVEDVEDVGEGPNIGDDDGGVEVDVGAGGGFLKVGEVEVEGVDEEGD